jgi:hypothetical protein
MKYFLLILATFSFFFTAMAAPKPAVIQKNVFQFENYTLNSLTAEKLTELNKLTQKETQRDIAQASDDRLKSIVERDAEYQTFSNDYQALNIEQSPVSFEIFVKRYQNLISENKITSNHVKYAVAQFLPILAFRSFAHRIRPLAEKASLTHSLLLNTAYSLVQSQKVLFPHRNSRGFIKYMTEPFESKDIDNAIKTPNDLQMFFYRDLYPQVLGSTNILLNLASSPESGSNPISIFDLRMIFSHGSFADDVQRFVPIYRVELFTILSALENQMSQIAFSISYDATDIVRVLNDIGIHIGFTDNSNLVGTIQGLPASKKAEILNKYPRFLRLKPGSDNALQQSWRHLTKAVDYAQISWTNLKNRPYSREFLINMEMIRPFILQGDLTLTRWKHLVSNSEPLPIRSFVTGITTMIQIHPLFKEQSAIQDLKSFLPRRFLPGNREIVKEIKSSDGTTKSVRVRNFNFGATDDKHPQAWDLNTYKVVFPEMTQAGDVYEFGNILSSAWGGGILGAPLMFVIL